MTQFKRLMDQESARAEQKRKGAKIGGWHEAAGLILEEVDEFWDEVKKKESKRDYDNLLKELVQVASLCERAAADLGLIDPADPDR